jgi:ABC-type nitrate/sulfonate/bicarbonate transport system substrate-binding protein
VRTFGKAVLVILATSWVSCRAPRPATESLRIGQVRVPVFGLLFVAQDLGFFEAQGLAVEFVSFESGRDALTAALKGEVDLASVYPTPVVSEALAGKPVVVIARVGRGDGLSGLVVRPGAGIQSGADLAKRRVGVTPNTSSALLADILLAEAGVPRDAVAWTYGSQAALLRKLEAGEVDAASLWEPNLLMTQRATERPNVLTTVAFSEMGAVATSRALAVQRGSTFIRFLRAVRSAQSAVQARSSLVEESLARRLPTLTPAEIAGLVSRTRFEVALSNLLLTTLRQEATWLEQNGLIRSAGVEIQDVIYPDLLEEVAPEAVTVLTADVDSPQVEDAQ